MLSSTLKQSEAEVSKSGTLPFPKRRSKTFHNKLNPALIQLKRSKLKIRSKSRQRKKITMDLQQDAKAFLEKLGEIAVAEAKKIDPHNKLDEKHISIQFIVRNPGEIHCGTGCFKLSNGHCFCYKVG